MTANSLARIEQYIADGEMRITIQTDRIDRQIRRNGAAEPTSWAFLTSLVERVRLCYQARANLLAYAWS